MRFRMRPSAQDDAAPAPAPVLETPKTDAPAPIQAPFAAHPNAFHRPLKTQMSGADVRTERFVRQVRGELDELGASIAPMREIPEELTGLDIDAVASNPEAAATLPPALLVRALVEARDHGRRLEKRVAKQRDRIERLEEKVRDLKQERAWVRGRQETLDEVIAALHANLEDLRSFRGPLQLEEGPEHPALAEPRPDPLPLPHEPE